MSSYYVTKTIHGRFVYYFMGVDRMGKPQWSGIVSNALTYSGITANEVASNIHSKFPFDDIGVKLVNKNNK